MILTHPHEDHINGVSDVWSNFKVLKVLDINDDGLTYMAKILKFLKEAFKQDEPAAADIELKLGRLQKYVDFRKDSKKKLTTNYHKCSRPAFRNTLNVYTSAKYTVGLEVLSPFEFLYSHLISDLKIIATQEEMRLSISNDSNTNPNLYSACLLFTINNEKFLFLADATSEMVNLLEGDIKNDLPIAFIKASHHGSPKGNPKSFWDMISNQNHPCYVAITRHETHDLPDVDVYQYIHGKVTATGGNVSVVGRDSTNKNFLQYDFSTGKLIKTDEVQ